MARFETVFYQDAISRGLPVPDYYEKDPFVSILYDFKENPPIIIADDRMEPEDANFFRDMSWIPVLLNKVAGGE